MNSNNSRFDAVELLRKMIAIPSPSGSEGGVADLLRSVAESAGYLVSRKGNNIWVRSPRWDDSKPTVLLDAHIDTVRPNPQWTRDPYSADVVDGRLYGLGSNDTGGSVVSMLSAFLTLAPTDQPFNLIWLASAEEENTGKGGIQSVLDELGAIDLVLVGEPTGMNAAIAEKGLLVLDCVAHGKAGHAARNEGVNAIYKAIEDIEWLRNYRFERVSPLLGEVKITVTGIEAGTLHNVVPAECRFMVDVRVNELYSNSEVIDTIVANLGSTVVPRSFNLNSSSIATTHPVVERCCSLGRSTYASPTTSNQAVLPYTSLKIGPGDSARSHTADEYIAVDEIREAERLFVAILDSLQINKTK